MCSSPITIDNPYYGLGRDIQTKVGKLKLSRSLNWLKNTHDTKIQVPCGSCRECVSMRQSFVLQRVQMESLRSHLFYFTLTYKESMVKRTNIGEYKVRYPFYDDIRNMFKRMRNAGHKFRYWVVSEYGTAEGKTHRPHYHGILAVPIDDPNNPYEFRIKEHFWSQYMLSEWKRNVSPLVWSEKRGKYVANTHPEYKTLLDYKCVWRNGRKNSTYDFHYIEPIRDHDNDVSFYVSKYILQYDDRTQSLLKKIKLDPFLSCDETQDLISKIKPRSIMSKDFGSYEYPTIKDYIDNCLSKDDQVPQYFDLFTGKSMLLAPYYRKHLMNVDWYMNRFMLYSISDTSFMLPDDSTNLEISQDTELALRKQQKFDEIKHKLKNKFL